MTTVIETGTTVEVAIEKALTALNVSREEVEIDVLSEGRKGFFGIGAKEAEVKVTVKAVTLKEVEVAPPIVSEEKIEEIPSTLEDEVQTEDVVTSIESSDLVEDGKDPVEETMNYLKSVTEAMGINDLEVTYTEDGKYIYFQLESKKAAYIIGKRGQTLNALQQLAQLIANQYSAQFKVIRLNVGDYRERREESLAQLANRMADKAVKTGRKVQLEPMPSYERKVLHHTLSDRIDIETYSEGTDPHRYLVIEPIQ